MAAALSSPITKEEIIQSFEELSSEAAEHLPKGLMYNIFKTNVPAPIELFYMERCPSALKGVYDGKKYFIIKVEEFDLETGREIRTGVGFIYKPKEDWCVVNKGELVKLDLIDLVSLNSLFKGSKVLSSNLTADGLRNNGRAIRLATPKKDGPSFFGIMRKFLGI